MTLTVLGLADEEMEVLAPPFIPGPSSYLDLCVRVPVQTVDLFSYLDLSPQVGFGPLSAESHMVPVSPSSSRSTGAK